MRRYILSMSFILVTLLISCEKSPQKRDVFFEKEEKPDGFVAFVLDKYDVKIYDISSFSLINTLSIPDIKRAFTYGDSVFLQDSKLYKYDFETNKAEVVKKIQPTPLYLILTGGGVYSINERGMLYNDEWVVEDTIIGYSEGYKNIWLLTPNNLISIDKSNGEKRIEELDNPVTFCISPYGLRVYLAFTDRIDVYLEKNFSLIKSVSIDDTPVELVTTPAGNKIYILTVESISVLDRATYTVRKMASLPTSADFLRLSRDGSYGILVCADRLMIFDAGTDEVVKEMNLSCKDVRTSPLDSKIYAITDSGMVSIRSDSLTIDRFIETEGEKIFIPMFKVGIKQPEEVTDYTLVSEDKTVRLFTIQVSSSKNRSGAQELVDRLISTGYPAYVIGSNGWFKVRVGAFREKGDALLVAENVDGVVKQKSWVLESDIQLSEIPVLSLRDLDGNGFMEQACIRDGKDILIFEIRDGIYEKIHTFTGYLEKYTGQPTFYDSDGDSKPEIVTPTLQGGIYSVIEYRDGKWIEEMKRFE